MKLFHVLSTVLLLSLCCSVARAQQVYTNEKIDFVIELPSTEWRVISEPDAALEFVFGDRLDGHLKIRKEVVAAGTTASDLAQRDQDQRLRFLPGFVAGKEEKFAGRTNGVTTSFEFIKTGKPMLGRVYYLESDNRTIFALRFTGLRDKLARIRNQTDSIARSFKVK